MVACSLRAPRPQLPSSHCLPKKGISSSNSQIRMPSMARSSARQASPAGDGSEGCMSRKPADKRPGSKASDRSESSASQPTTNSTVHSLYDLLGVARDATPREITAAYRRKALLCHPDKIRQQQKSGSESSTDGGGKAAGISVEEATKHFQQLQAAYGVLNDPQKRSRYDRTGETDANGLEGASYEEAYAFYRAMFPEVTEDAINQFKASYVGSNEEKEDIIDFAHKFKGDLSKFFEFIPFSEPSDAERYIEVLSSLVEEKKIKETSAYKQTLRDFGNIAKKYEKRLAREMKAGEKRKAKMTDDTSALTLAILGNMSKREKASNRLLEELERKYAKKSKK